MAIKYFVLPTMLRLISNWFYGVTIGHCLLLLAIECVVYWKSIVHLIFISNWDASHYFNIICNNKTHHFADEIQKMKWKLCVHTCFLPRIVNLFFFNVIVSTRLCRPILSYTNTFQNLRDIKQLFCWVRAQNACNKTKSTFETTTIFCVVYFYIIATTLKCLHSFLKHCITLVTNPCIWILNETNDMILK